MRAGGTARGRAVVGIEEADVSHSYCCRCYTRCDGRSPCPPTWLVWNPETGDEDNAWTVRAHSPELAVETWASLSDSESADYLIVRGEGDQTAAHVRADHKGSPLRVFLVHVPSYTAKERA